MDKDVYIVPLLLSDKGIYWTDFASDYIEKIDPDVEWDNYMYFTLYLTQDGEINFNRPIRCNYSEMGIAEKEQIYTIFDQHLPDHLVWSGSNNESIAVHYEPQEDNGRKALKEDDFYPRVRFDIQVSYKKMEKYGLSLIDYGIEDIPQVQRIKAVLEDNADFVDEEYGSCDITFYAYGVTDPEPIKELSDIP